MIQEAKMSTEKIVLEQLVQGPAAETYLAFTNATMLRRWMCDIATVSPRLGGRLYLAWNSGYYASGEYTYLKADQMVGFSWYGRNEPALTQVNITLTQKDSSTWVHLEHSGLGNGVEWDATRKEMESGWISSLENLASVIGTGEDQRITLRPMLGILIGEYNPEIAKELNVPVTQGMHLGGVVEGMGAETAGLLKDDVLVSMDNQPLTNPGDLGPILQRRRAGDRIMTTLYRGPDLLQLEITLGSRHIPEIPWTMEGLAAAVQERNAGITAELEQLFVGVTEAEASYHPAPGEWGVKEILAHLIHGERYAAFEAVGNVLNQEQWTDDWEGNPTYQVEATVAAFPTLADLVDELKRLYVENASLYAHLPKDLPKRKSIYWRLAYGVLQPDYHFQEHAEDMRGLIVAARSQ